MRVMVVDDHALVRSGLRAVLGMTDDCTVVGEAGTGEEALDLAAEVAPDVVVMDLSMPGIGGVAATAELRARFPGLRVLVLTTFADDDRVRAALSAGATGYLLKDAAPDDVVRAVRAAGRDEVPIDPRVARSLLPRMRDADTSDVGPSDRNTSTSNPRTSASGPDIPPRERDVLVLVARGMSNKQIGTALGIAERTVKAHLGNVFRRIGVTDRTSAALWARDHGY
ncbi:MAG: response regulator transcription factor [Curtobacterium sp.]|jgi:DNA-binding NarL/FixJ family response regulator|uniref:response regulator n=1 Tax=unclassified Curtobacterium TaxID=257496 RepID=UPI0031A1B294